MFWGKIIVPDGEIRFVNVMVVCDVPESTIPGTTDGAIDVLTAKVAALTVKVGGKTISIIINPV
jgi:hypothetical protein